MFLLYILWSADNGISLYERKGTNTERTIRVIYYCRVMLKFKSGDERNMGGVFEYKHRELLTHAWHIPEHTHANNLQNAIYREVFM